MQPLFVQIDPTPSTSGLSSDAKYEQVEYGQVKFNDFRSVKRLGRGAYGTVVQGIFRNKPVAVKFVETDLDFGHIHTEAKMLNTFKHDNIIKLIATFYGEQSGLLLELMVGGSLHELLHQHLHIQFKTCHMIGWVQQVLSALRYLHSHGFVHRDLKPSNMLLTNDFMTLKLCDFGTAAELRTSMTNNRGSAAWMAPEVFRGKRYDQKCDIFSFGIFLWELIARKQPFSDNDGNPYTLLWQVSEGKRPPKLNCPKVFTNMMENCWNDKPSERPCVEELCDVMYSICSSVRGYQNMHIPLIDRTTGDQAFAHPPNKNMHTPPPYPGTSNHYQPVHRSPVPPPIPPPPRISGHQRTSSHDFNLYGRPTDENRYIGQAVGYHPLISNIGLPPLPPQHNHHSFQTGIPPNSPPMEIGWRRSSEPPFSDNDSAYGTGQTQPKPKKKDRFSIGSLITSITKRS